MATAMAITAMATATAMTTATITITATITATDMTTKMTMQKEEQKKINVDGILLKWQCLITNPCSQTRLIRSALWQARTWNRRLARQHLLQWEWSSGCTWSAVHAIWITESLLVWSRHLRNQNVPSVTITTVTGMVGFTLARGAGKSLRSKATALTLTT